MDCNQAIKSFSILERIVVVETVPQVDWRQCDPHTFSILERIVVVETIQHTLFHGDVIVFQYPRTDRGG